jgi:DNA-binding transcriptional LysR family regulator
VRLDIIVGGDPVDIAAEGYDAGVRLGETIDQDMYVVAASGEQRLVVVGAPAYLASHAAPRHPGDFAAHTCIQLEGNSHA